MTIYYQCRDEETTNNHNPKPETIRKQPISNTTAKLAIHNPSAQSGEVPAVHTDKGRLTIAEFDIFTHDAIITILNRKTGNHRTFWVRTMPEDSGRHAGRRLVHLLTGPDNSSDGDWRPFADVKDRKVAVWSGYAGPNGDRYGARAQYTAYQQFARMLAEPATFAAKGAEYMISGKCRSCGRPLTAPESVMTGIGPICAGRE